MAIILVKRQCQAKDHGKCIFTWESHLKLLKRNLLTTDLRMSPIIVVEGAQKYLRVGMK